MDQRPADHLTTEPATAEQIAARARDMGPRERESFIAYQCGDNQGLHSQVLALLAQQESGAHYWLGASDDAELPRSLIGARLGAYQLQQLLGSGGMGEVYLATRQDGEFTQQVAIKLVRSQLLNDDVRSRLRTERQILASLRHPNIATLLDGGTAPDGTPYLVMEYIDGVAIDIYCDRQQLSIEQRLQLFIKVCAAVHCAHQSLIVHRDLKPSNILVTASGEPKLLDFGIAKLLDAQPIHDVAVTHYNMRVMTPAHAAPEQVRGELITTASDIYVLGVVLYELLCGRRPFTLPPNCRLADIERLVCHTAPALPSEQLQRTAHAFPELSRDIVESRAGSLHKLLRQLRGDLDQIVMMAMRKEPSRRYSSAAQMAEDLQHWLAGRPVLANRDSWWYRSRKFVARHALAVSAISAAALVLLGFSLVTWQQARDIARQRDAIAAERNRAEQVSSFLVDLFEFSDPARNRGNDLKARELLDVGARRINSHLETQPATRATLLSTIGRVYGSLGLYHEAVGSLRQASTLLTELAGNNTDSVQAQLALADALIGAGELAAADQQLQTVLQHQARVYGPNALQLAPIYHLLGKLSLERGSYGGAEDNLRAALQRYEQARVGDDLAKAETLSELGKTLADSYREAEAEPLYQQALAITTRLLGADHPRVVDLQSRLADALEGERRYGEAGPLFLSALQTKRRVLGNEHPLTIDALENYGNFLRRSGSYAQARAVLTEALQANRKLYGERHEYVGYDRVNLALLNYDTRQYQDAEQGFRLALNIYAQTIDKNDVLNAGALIGLGRSLIQQGRAREALPPLQQAIAVAIEALGTNNPVEHTGKAALGLAHLQLKNLSQARELLNNSQADVLRTYGPNAVISREVNAGLQQLAHR